MKRLLWRTVYKSIKPKMFFGVYDAEHGSEVYMFGIMTVMEYIAANAGMLEEFEKVWWKNFQESKEKANDCKS